MRHLKSTKRDKEQKLIVVYAVPNVLEMKGEEGMGRSNREEWVKQWCHECEKSELNCDGHECEKAELNRDVASVKRVS